MYNIGVVNISLAVIGLVMILFLLKKRHGGKAQSKGTQIAQGAEAAYYAKKNQNAEEKLTIQEKLELSWKFLYEMAEIVINKFSPEDKEAVQKIGQDLVNAGMKYEHIIDLGIKHKVSKVASLELNQDKEGKSRGG